MQQKSFPPFSYRQEIQIWLNKDEVWERGKECCISLVVSLGAEVASVALLSELLPLASSPLPRSLLQAVGAAAWLHPQARATGPEAVSFYSLALTRALMWVLRDSMHIHTEL